MNIMIELHTKIDKIKKMGWIKCKNNNINIAGLTFENLLGKENENFPIADYNGIEIKTRRKNSYSRITLFSSVPDSFLFENKRLVELYGYPDKTLPQFKVINCIVQCNTLTYISNNHFFGLYVNRKEEKIFLNVYKGPYKLVENTTSWSFELLKEKINLKLKYLCYVNFEKVCYKKDIYVKYISDKYYVLRDFNKFLELIENGKIYICIKLGVYKSGKKFGQLHDHGTSFDIMEENLSLLFQEII